MTTTVRPDSDMAIPAPPTDHQTPAGASRINGHDDRQTQNISMKAIVQDKYGSSRVLELRDTDKPEVGEDDVLVRVKCGWRAYRRL